jgi:hypothetical protein
MTLKVLTIVALTTVAGILDVSFWPKNCPVGADHRAESVSSLS